MPIWTWSQTAATNATADSTINWAEGQAPSTVNDSARAMMAATAKWRDDISGTITTGGTSTAYTVASNSVYDSLAHMNGAIISFVPHTDCGNTVTLAVDGLTAKPLRAAPSTDLSAGQLVSGVPYICTYNNADAVFYLHNLGRIMPLKSRVAADVTTSSNTTLAAVTGLSVSLSAGRTYAIDVWLAADGGGTAGGIRAALSGTATITNLVIQGFLLTGGTLGDTGTSDSFDAVVVSQNGSTNLQGYIKGTITVNAAGTLIVTAAQDTSSPDTLTIKRGSWLIATDIT